VRKNSCGALLAVIGIVLVGSIGGDASSEGSSILPWSLYQEALRWQVMEPEAGVPCEALLFILVEPAEDYHIERLIEAGYAIGGVYGRFVSVLAPITLYIDEVSGADALDFVQSTLPELEDWHNMEWSGLSDEQPAACLAISSIVDFPDPVLGTIIRDAIGKPSGDIYETDLIGLTKLRAYGRDIVNLEGIHHCVDLTVIVLFNSQIVDISPLAGLSNLGELYLDNNQIVDITPLSGLTNLRGLHLADNEIVDISPLSGLTKLTELWLDNNGIVNITPLQGLTNLSELELGSNQIVDISPLLSLTNLTYLYLAGNDLALAPGSPDMLDIEALRGRGVRVDLSQRPRN